MPTDAECAYAFGRHDSSAARRRSGEIVVLEGDEVASTLAPLVGQVSVPRSPGTNGRTAADLAANAPEKPLAAYLFVRGGDRATTCAGVAVSRGMWSSEDPGASPEPEAGRDRKAGVGAGLAALVVRSIENAPEKPRATSS